MSDAEIVELIGYGLGCFGLGWGLGVLTAAIKRTLDFL